MSRNRTLAAVALVAALGVAPVWAQTDDRIVNDVFTVLHGETLLARTRQLCRDMAGIDLDATFGTWTDNNLEPLRLASSLLETRPGVEWEAVAAMRQEAAREAEAAFAREAGDWPAYCEGLRDSMESGESDLLEWFPFETRRMAEAEQGKWPLLDLSESQPVADAMAVKQIGFMMNDVFVRCATLYGQAAVFEAAWQEWESRNAYSIELADRVLRNWGALHPRRWEQARDESGDEVSALFDDAERAEAHCRSTAARVETGEEDIDQVRPELFASVRENAQIIPVQP